ncbi:LamG-like jellyroll fold domain-containing protein [Pseudactinotalea sp.]|uniref:LamG-like jellyroll fold domain-containing protein n=1 Tax=Pseudactinotalea sp. TaxID=1926260 RepID=UPI003B3BA58A
MFGVTIAVAPPGETAHADVAVIETASTWTLDGDARDSVSERHGTVLPGVTFEDGSAHFSGTDDSEIELPYDRALEPGNRTWRLTLSGVVPAELTGTHQAIATSRSTNNQGWAVYIMPDGELRFWSRVVGQGQWAQYPTGITMTPGSSYDIAVTREDEKVRLQVDGAESADIVVDMGLPIVNNGSNPIRLGNGGDNGTDFFYRGSIAEVTLATTSPAAPWATCEPQPGVSDAVEPPAADILDRPIPQDEMSVLSLTAAQNANRYISTTWWADKAFVDEEADRIDLAGRVAGTEYALRGVGMAAVSTAILLATGTYSAEDTGVAESEARERIVRLVSSAAAEHRANTTGGWGPETAQWQASLWAYYNAFAAWLLWEEFSPQQQTCVSNMVALEANAMPDPEYYRNADGVIIRPGNTQAEENAWRSSLSGLASIMMPTAPSSAEWRDDALALSIAAWATPEDLAAGGSVNGRPLADVLDGSNVESDGTVENHNLMHPIYMLAFDQSVNNALAQQLTGQLPATAFFHNIDLTYHAFVDLTFDAPPWRAPGGTIYVPDSRDIYYPDGNDWGSTFPLYFAQADVIAASFGLDSGVSTPADTWAMAHLEHAVELQDRFDDGRTYLDNSESNYGIREVRTAQIDAHTFLTRFLNAADQVCMTDRPYTTATTDPLLGELEAVSAALEGPGGADLADDLHASLEEGVKELAAAHEAGTSAAVDSTLRELQLLLAAAPAGLAAVTEVRAALDHANQCLIGLPIALSTVSAASPGATISVGVTGANPDHDYALTLDDGAVPSPQATAAVLATTEIGSLATGADGAGTATITLPSEIPEGPVTLRAVAGDSVVETTLVIQAADPDPTDPGTTDDASSPGGDDGPSDAGSHSDNASDGTPTTGGSGGSPEFADTGASPALLALIAVAAAAIVAGVALQLRRQRHGRD